jgi:hypothetical protein
MKLFSVFRIFKRLRELEAAQVEYTREIVTGREEDRRAAREYFDAAMAEHEAKVGPCARCGSIVQLRVRTNGPRLMEHTGVDGAIRTVILCNECIPAAKRDGWRTPQPADAPPPLAIIPKETEGVPA